MPNITIYLTNEEFAKFIKMDEQEANSLKKKFIEGLRKVK